LRELRATLKDFSINSSTFFSKTEQFRPFDWIRKETPKLSLDFSEKIAQNCANCSVVRKW
jgi:hypothetical protein